eukprot:gnl/TRDRNA2_/TRDRNA2_168871_c0_seq8.p1 gnl/TRDRNA2_/TRDRNA2_168871_c0~~gnl/TRDRNA2_/TRDRNA2_168871_c0_seq8.p1  ORF type:complete len:601 (-),score=25.28 gnl/TRDRNA2_/TRDRNA2_168871_c0_seq8:272-2074(-)
MMHGANPAFLLTLFHTHVCTGVMISTSEHGKGTDEVSLLQVKVEAWKPDTNSTAQEAMVTTSQDTEADLHKQGYEGLNEQAGVTQDRHRATPAEMLLKQVEKIDEEYEQPLPPLMLSMVDQFRIQLMSILSNLLQNRLDVLTDLDAKLAAISNTGQTTGGFSLPTFISLRSTQETSVRSMKQAIDDCDNPANNPVDVTTQCDTLQTQRMNLAAHECAQRQTSTQICAQQGVQPDGDDLMQFASWDAFISARGPYCIFYEGTPTFLTRYQDWFTGCATEVSDNANRVSTYNAACASADTDYQLAYCNWRNHWIEGCTRDLRQDYNDLVQAYLGARTSMINVLDPEWNAEFITIKKILCFLNVWLGRANAELLGNGDMHAHATKEFCMDQHLNPINPADMNTGEIEGITADLRPHLPDPATLIPALGNCDYSVVNDAYFGYPAANFNCQAPLAEIALWAPVVFTEVLSAQSTSSSAVFAVCPVPTTLTGCTCYSPDDSCKGAVFQNYRCFAYPNDNGWVVAQARCGELPHSSGWIDVTSLLSAVDDASITAECPHGKTLTGCTCNSPQDSCDGAQSSGNTCTAYANGNGGAVVAQARCGVIQ